MQRSPQSSTPAQPLKRSTKTFKRKQITDNQVCSDLDVDATPILAAAGLVVAPLLSWYDCGFDAADPRCVGGDDTRRLGGLAGLL